MRGGAFFLTGAKQPFFVSLPPSGKCHNANTKTYPNANTIHYVPILYYSLKGSFFALKKQAWTV